MQRTTKGSALALLLLAIAALGTSEAGSVWERLGTPREDVGGAKSGRDAEQIGSARTRGIWVTSVQGKSWVTGDGGETWIANSYPQDVVVEGLTFIDSNHAWAAGAVRSQTTWLASTSDGGKTWHAAPTTPDSRPGGFVDVQFFDKDFGIAVGVGDSDQGGKSLIAITRDGGTSWKSQLFKDKDDPASVLMRVRFQSRSVVWVVGGNSIYSSHDGGASWQLAHRERGATRLDSVAIVENSGIFVAGGWGLLLRSRDSGATWERLKVPATAEHRYLCALDFADTLHGWVGGDHGTVISTGDGGETWQEENTGVDGLVRDISVIGDHVYVAGDSFFVLRRHL
jgi:photosystem II stability/assembly factor-like uncharacterized protein